MQNFSVLVHARPAAPPATSAIATTPNSAAAPTYRITMVPRLASGPRIACQMRLSMTFSRSCGLPGQDPLDHFLDLGVVLGLEVVVLLFLAVHLHLGIGGQVRVELRLGVRLALVFRRGLL